MNPDSELKSSFVQENSENRTSGTKSVKFIEDTSHPVRKNMNRPNMNRHYSELPLKIQDIELVSQNGYNSPRMDIKSYVSQPHYE